jgi:type IV secretory pathway VirB2 component (pilin)
MTLFAEAVLASGGWKNPVAFWISLAVVLAIGAMIWFGRGDKDRRK